MTHLLLVLAQSAPEPPAASQPIPLVWFVLAGLLALLGIVFLIRGSLREWQASNLFDRRYRFPPAPAARPRFGGVKSGGRMATVSFASARKNE